MTRVKLSDARPGQALDEDVSDPQGGTIASAGTALTPELIETLRTHGIGEVALRIAAASPADDELDRMFEGTLDTPLMAALLDAAKRRRAGKTG